MRNYNNSSGFYNWASQSSMLYEITKLRRTGYKGSAFFWNPFLLCLWDINKVVASLDDYGGPLIINNHNIKMSSVDKGYEFKQYEEIPSVEYDLIKEKLGLNDDGLYQIDQDENGLDKIDRIEIGVNLIFSIVNQTWN